MGTTSKNATVRMTKIAPTRRYERRSDTFRTHLYTWIYEKHCLAMRNPGNDEAIHVDYVKHDPVLRNIGNDEVIHMDYGRHGSINQSFHFSTDEQFLFCLFLLLFFYYRELSLVSCDHSALWSAIRFQNRSSIRVLELSTS